MNSVFHKNRSPLGGGRIRNLVLSIVILVEVIALLSVATYAWVETVSAVKIKTEDQNPGTVNTFVYTIADIKEKDAAIDLGKYFKQGGDMHLAPASSVDGVNMLFPKTAGASGYRWGNSSDKNVSYLSISFRIHCDESSDFYFEGEPSFGSFNENIRASVIARDVGSASSETNYIFGRTADSSQAVVKDTSGDTSNIAVKSFSSYTRSGGNRLFRVNQGTDKLVTVNLWLQKNSADTDLTSNTNMAEDFNISDFCITSTFVPRTITFIPTAAWDDGTTGTYYAWCWGSKPSKLYKLSKDAETEHYTFEYNREGYENTLFFRSSRSDLQTSSMSSAWSSLGLQYKSVDTAIPDSPENPTCIVEVLRGGAVSSDIGNQKMSTVTWETPVTVHLAYVTGQNSGWGSLSGTSYVGTTTSTTVMEKTSSTATVHSTTLHARAGKKLQLTATVKDSAHYAFVGWYSNASGTTLLSTSPTYTSDVSTTDTEVVYYAKFKERRTLTIDKYVDGVKSTTAAGTITINSSTSSASVNTYSATVDKGSSVTFSATANKGYTLEGIFTTATGDAEAASPKTLDDDTTYYARFTTNSHDVKAHAAYVSSSSGTTYSESNSGGTVQAGDAAASSGTETVSKKSVKYNTTVVLKATAANGYSFEGWYTSLNGGTRKSTSASYTYTLTDDNDVDVYARFKRKSYTVSLSVDTETTYGTMTTPGNKVKIDSGTAGTSAASTIDSLTSVTLTATTTYSYYTFDGWYNGSTKVSSSASYTFEPTSNVSYTAKFKQVYKAYYFQNTRDWSGTIYLYAWNSSNENNHAWPGVAGTYVGKSSGHDMWEFYVWTKYETAIMNNDDKQSGNVSFSSFGSNNAVWFNDSSNPGGYWTYTKP